MIPTILYYLGILLAIEIDAREYGTHVGRDVDATRRWRLLLRFGYHFLSLFVIIGFMAVGRTAVQGRGLRDVLVQFALSFLDREHRLTAAAAVQGACPGHPFGAAGGGHLRDRRRDRRGHHPDRARA